MRWLIFAVFFIAGNLICLWHFIKCLKAKGSKNRKGGYRAYYSRNRGGITEEEKEELIKYLDQL